MNSIIKYYLNNRRSYHHVTISNKKRFSLLLLLTRVHIIIIDQYSLYNYIYIIYFYLKQVIFIILNDLFEYYTIQSYFH